MELPKEFKERMKMMLQDEFSDFEKAFSDTLINTGLRINIRKKAAAKTMEGITRGLEKISWCDNGYYCDKSVLSGNHPYHTAGLCYFQEPSAMAVVEALDIKENDFVLDLCAAPGGKATQAGEKLSDKGLLVANEIIPKRAGILAENIERMGISNAIVTNEAPEKLAQRLEGFFDKIIVDAPCSGEGMFRKEPQAITEWSINHTKTCAVRQKHIMDCAYKMLKSGGKIVYSTCTFAPCENEGVVDYFLEKYDDISLIDTGLNMLSRGVGEWVNSRFDLSKTRRIFPHKNKGEGHFIALFQKDGICKANSECERKNTKEDSNIKLFREFEKNVFYEPLSGEFAMFGENLYLVPHAINTDKLKVVRGGFHLGTVKKNRFEPSHALALASDVGNLKSYISFDADDTLLNKYLHGETIPTDLTGYTAVCIEGNPIGWGKGTDGVLKNHFPKYMRLK